MKNIGGPTVRQSPQILLPPNLEARREPCSYVR